MARSTIATVTTPLPNDLHEWVSFDDHEEDRTWVFDVTFLTSSWNCIFGNGCQGVLTGTAEELVQGCCSYGAHFVDADDVWSPGCLEALVAALDANATAPLAVARFSTVDWAGRPVEVSSYPTWVDAPQRPVRLHLEASSVLDFATASSRLCFPPPAGVLVRRSAYEAVGGFDPGVARSEDVFTWIKMTQLGSGVLATDAHFSYRVHDAQRSQSSGRGRGAIRARVLGLSVACDRSLLLVSLHGAIVTYATFARERISAGLRRRDAHALGAGLRNFAICGYLAGWALVWLVIPNAVRVRRFAGGIDRGLRRS